MSFLVRMAEELASAWDMLTRKPMQSMTLLEGVDGGNALLGKDGSLATVIRVEGVKHVMGQQELNTLIEQMNIQMAPYLDSPGRAIQVWFARDPETSKRIVEHVMQSPRDVAAKVGLSLDDLFDEREKNLPNHIVWEGFYMVLWTRRSVLTKHEMEAIKEETKVPSAWPQSFDAQNLFLAAQRIRDRHTAFVSSLHAGLEQVGIRAKVLDHREALRAIRSSLYPDAIGADWRPVLPGDYRMPGRPESEIDHSHLFPPKLETQLFDRDAEMVNGKVAKIGRYYVGTVSMQVGPLEPMLFSQLIRRMRQQGEFPWRVSFMIEGDGLGRMGIKGALASVMAFTSNDNKQIRDAIKGLKELKTSESEVVPRLRVVFGTWAEIDGEASLKTIEERISKLQNVVGSWGYCQTSSLVGDPVEGAVSSSMGLDCSSVAPGGAPLMRDLIHMLPWDRDASPWKQGAVLFRTPDGRPWPYQPGSSMQNTFIDLVFAPPGLGKSVFLNSTSLALCLSTAATAGTGGAKLPQIAILDVGPSSSGLISLLRESLPSERRHEVVYERLQMIKDYAINPFDTQLGCRVPMPLERSFLVNFLTLIGTPVGDAKAPSGLSDLAGQVVDAVYDIKNDKNRKGDPNPYMEGEDREADAVIAKWGINADEETWTWWDVVDKLFELGDTHGAHLAQRNAVPKLEDVAVVVRSPQVHDLFGKARTQTGENLIDVFQRMVSNALKEYPILTCPTRLDLGDARIVALDLDEAAPRGSGPAEKQTALVYMLGRFVLARDFYLNERQLEYFPKEYRSHHSKRIRRIRETPKRIVYDEFHRTQSSDEVRQQVILDMREGRKWGVQIVLASQLLDDFDDDMVKMATGVFIMGAPNEKAAEECRSTFGLSETAVQIIKRVLHGPGKGGAPFLANLLLKDGRHEHLLYNTLGPTELWAFSTTAQDSALRNNLYSILGPQEARRRLARRYPGGSAVPEIERRVAKMMEEGETGGDEASGSVIDSLAEEIVKSD